MKVLTAEEMREVDRLTSERHGISTLQLMENAGSRVAAAADDFARAAALNPANISVLCGKGNNGGDGFVAARVLQGTGARVRVFLFAKPEDLRGDAAANFERWSESGDSVTSIDSEDSWATAWPQLANADIIVDAIFGTGFRGPAAGAIASAISAINRLSKNATAARPAWILAVDTPSGLPSVDQPAQGEVLYAHKTVTFTAPKVAQLVSPNSGAVGRLEVADIGSPRSLPEEVGRGALRWIEPREFAGLPFVRRFDSHKGLYGHLLVVAGSLGKGGAAVMAGYAGLRSGAGLVTVATPDIIAATVSSSHPEYMTEPLASTLEGTASMENLAHRRFAEIEEGKTVLAVGPGLGLQPETQEFIRNIVLQTELPVILDADGLNAFAGNGDALRERKTRFLAITPHPGEMARLLMISTTNVQENRLQTAQQAARRWNLHVVLKGSHTIVAAPDGQVFVNTSGNPGLSKGGSGDVLTGLLGALTAQFKTDDWTRVLALGVYLHGKAAELAASGADESGLLATEVATALPLARRQLLEELRRRA